MSAAAWVQLLVIVGILAVLVPVTGRYLAAVYSGRPAPGDRVFGPVDRLVYRICGIDESSEQRWTGYLRSLLAFSLIGFVVLYLILRFQDVLPLNPQGFVGVPPDLAFNTAVSSREPCRAIRSSWVRCRRRSRSIRPSVS
jgi:K+-transporting ATPase ATPase A chain